MHKKEIQSVNRQEGDAYMQVDKRGFHTGKWKTTYTQESRQEENTIYRKVDKKYIQVSTQEADIYR